LCRSTYGQHTAQLLTKLKNQAISFLDTFDLDALFIPNAMTLPFRLKFRQMVLLDALGDSFSLRKAAHVANLTQPAATRAISELESAFGVVLFERSHRGMTPTVFGDALIRHARQLLFDVQRAHEDIQALRAGSHGFVRIGALLSSAVRLLPMVIGDIKQHYPGLTVSVEQLPQPPLIHKVREGSLDIILCRRVTDADVAQHLTQTVLFDDDFVLVASRSNRFAKTKKIKLMGRTELLTCLATQNSFGKIRDQAQQVYLKISIRIIDQ